MPVYEFECPKCGGVVEKLILDASAEIEHPCCDGTIAGNEKHEPIIMEKKLSVISKPVIH